MVVLPAATAVIVAVCRGGFLLRLDLLGFCVASVVFLRIQSVVLKQPQCAHLV